MDKFVTEIKYIIDSARQNAVRSVDFCRVQMYWQIGNRIVEHEQGGEIRAEYGKALIANLAKEIEPLYGSGFSKRQLERARQFYITYPIASALRTQFNWTQYKLLIAISDPAKREYYELEALHNNWTARQLERQINSLLFERLLLSSDKEKVLNVARRQNRPSAPQDILKNPMVLEFLGLERKPHYYESELENAIINHLQEFIMELGNGFTFAARQKRILLEDDEFFIDLVFYNRLLRCFVVFELKTHKARYEDLGQLQMYVNYYDRFEKTEDENPTIGVLLCTEKNDTMIKLTLPPDSNILATKFQLYFPNQEQLIKEIDSIKDEFMNQHGELSE